jgi:hypothetical protein
MCKTGDAMEMIWGTNPSNDPEQIRQRLIKNGILKNGRNK